MPETPDWHPSRFLASLYSPASERPVLNALFGVESEIAASLQGGLDHNVAHIRLQWWREECERLSQGNPAHPLTRALVAEFAAATALKGLSGFVDVAVWDLAAATFETRRELTAYCERWASAMILPAVTHAVPDMANVAPWLAIGSAMHEIEMLAHLATEAKAGRLRVPLDELDCIAVETGSLAMTPWPTPLATLLGQRHEALRSMLCESVAHVDRTDQPALRGLLVWADIAWRRSRRAQGALPNALLAPRAHGLAGAWHAWRGARRAVAGRFSLN
jgi:15-cis-phytoene synthase